MKDRRLIGTWKSDGRKTAEEIAARRDIPANKKQTLQKIFGKLEIRYTATQCYSQFGDHVSVSRYQVVAKDSSSVALVVLNPVAGKQIVHIHFEGNRYWITLGSGRMREWFKRIKPTKSGRSRVEAAN